MSSNIENFGNFENDLNGDSKPLDLFQSAESNSAGVKSREGAPLAFRMRPQELDEVLGHEKVLGPGKPLRQWIETDRVPSLILWGPPGCGKTTLGQIIAHRTKSRFVALSAVLSGVKDIKEAVERAREYRRLGHKTLLFVDEIHRFNKSQQDALLPHVENGTVILIGATTENPSFELNTALLSRVSVIRLEPIEPEALTKILDRALKDPESGLGSVLPLSPEAVEWLANSSEGDARRALTTLENAALYFAQRSPEGSISVEELQKALEASVKAIPYDKAGEEHYNVISAFIKSLRDSDPDAGLYYLARMLEGGEDPLFIARRLVILASEDIGNADPNALRVALNAKEAVDFIGMPEARITLGQAVTYLAVAPKSNASYVGINEALDEVRRSGALPVPMHLRNGVTSFMKQQGYGQGYRYAHDDPAGATDQKHLPEKIQNRRFYRPKNSGVEAKIKEKLDSRNK